MLSISLKTDKQSVTMVTDLLILGKILEAIQKRDIVTTSH